MKRKGMVGKIPYNQIHKVKKTEHIIINNVDKNLTKQKSKSFRESNLPENKQNILANAGASLIVQKYKARPVRYEGNTGKVTLSPLLIDLPLNEG